MRARSGSAGALRADRHGGKTPSSCIALDGYRRPSRSPNKGVDPTSHVIGYHVCHRARVTPNNVSHEARHRQWLRSGGMDVKMHRTVAFLSVVLLSATLLSACASSSGTMSESQSSPSERYLNTELADGWVRTVGDDNGFVLVFETPETFEAGGAWDYRLVLFNESGADVTLDELTWGARGRVDRANWEGFSFGLTGPYLAEPLPRVVLRSGESTTQELSQVLGDPPLEYEITAIARGHGGDVAFQSQTPTVTVVSK